MSNPLEAKKLVFDPIYMQFEDSLGAQSYFAMVLSVSPYFCGI